MSPTPFDPAYYPPYDPQASQQQLPSVWEAQQQYPAWEAQQQYAAWGAQQQYPPWEAQQQYPAWEAQQQYPAWEAQQQYAAWEAQQYPAWEQQQQYAAWRPGPQLPAGEPASQPLVWSPVSRSSWEFAPPPPDPWVQEAFGYEQTAPTPEEPWPEAAPADAAPAQPTKGKKTLQTVFNILFYALIVAIVGGAAMFALSNNPQKSYLGYRLYTVKTPSMTPREDGSSPPGGFRVGDAILVKLCSPETIRMGDIITFVPGSDPSVYLTHRVVEVLDHLNDDKGIFFVTRGDANDSNDSPIKGEMVVGKKVFSVPGVGVVLQFIRDNFVLTLILIASSIGFIILLRMYVSPSDTGKKKKEQQS